MSKMKPILLLLIRVTVGWHFLYEGLIKLFSPEWSSAGYLEGSYGFLSGFYHSIAANASILGFVNFVNIWGLILIGAGLFLGIFVNISAISGMILLTLYYFAYPPFGTHLNVVHEGHYWFVDRNLMEIVVLGFICYFPSSDFSLVNVVKRWFKKSAVKNLSPEEGEKRREILKGLATLPFFGGVIYAAALQSEKGVDGLSGATKVLKTSSLKDLKAQAPLGKLGNLEVSRIIGGCNQIMGYSHARDLSYVSDLFRHYNTEQKLFETFALFDASGINTTNMVVGAYPLFNKYKKATGSKMQSICQVHLSPKDLFTEIKQAIGFGATTMYIQGGWGDMLVHAGRFDLIHQVLDYIKSQGILAGMGGHSIQVAIACEREGIKPDYYFKTMHHDQYWSATPREFREEFSLRSDDPSDPKVRSAFDKTNDNIFDLFPEQTVEVFSKITVPLVGFKVMAGGAITPKDGFRYAFEKGADFICVGMFDWQVVENVNLVNTILHSKLERSRPWFS
jgi:uncharacterized membrane protein YphA (DoxX/SURF4 family)